MITLPNRHSFTYVVASGALEFHGRGYFWERLLVAMGLIKPEYFTVTLKTLTRLPRKGNLSWWHPWTCVRIISGGAVNKVGLTNPGIEHWLKFIAPKIDFKKYKIVVSIHGTKEDLLEMVEMLNKLKGIVAIEINVSCPNDGEGDKAASMVIDTANAVYFASEHPLFLKLSEDQEYKLIGTQTRDVVSAYTINSVKWKRAFPFNRSPLHRLEARVGGGGGGVSGYPAQESNWRMVKELVCLKLPVIAPSVMTEHDVCHALGRLGAPAVSFGTIHLPSHPVWLKPWTIFTNPTKPTRIVKRLSV